MVAIAKVSAENTALIATVTELTKAVKALKQNMATLTETGSNKSKENEKLEGPAKNKSWIYIKGMTLDKARPNSKKQW